MQFIKTLFAFIIGMIATLLCYTYISIPIIPSFTVYIVFMLFASNSYLKLKRLFVIITGIFGIYLFGAGAIESIIYYPDYMNILGIVCSFVTAFSYIGTTITGCAVTSKNI